VPPSAEVQQAAAHGDAADGNWLWDTGPIRLARSVVGRSVRRRPAERLPTSV